VTPFFRNGESASLSSPSDPSVTSFNPELSSEESDNTIIGDFEERIHILPELVDDPGIVSMDTDLSLAD